MDEATTRTTGGLTPERIAQIRRRIVAGMYDTPEVHDQVARRMIERGDVIELWQ